jgi:glucose/arabinose dehydrogenase
MQFSYRYLLPLLGLAAVACATKTPKAAEDPESRKVMEAAVENSGQILPEPQPGTRTVNTSNVIGWPSDKMPKAPAGFRVIRFAKNLANPRWIYAGPSGDIFVAESNTVPHTDDARKKKKMKGDSEDQSASANRILRFRDDNADGIADKKEVFASGLNQPFGMLVLGKYFYVGNTDGVWRFPYKIGQTKLDSKQGKKILSLPAGGYNNHWTRNLLASPDGRKIYVTVGSGSNVGENGMDNEKRRANILEINPDGSGERIFASGLRNPVGLDWNPSTGALWTAVNERDELGDELVPDYITSVKEGGFYGWPYAYIGNHEDPRLKGQRPDLVQKSIVPDVLLGSHTASLGLAFYKQTQFPTRYHGGAFVGQRGSWNRSELTGLRVAYVPFANGHPSGPAEDFLTGFIKDSGSNDVYGRPVGVSVLANGMMLVADDAGGTIWAVKPE